MRGKVEAGLQIIRRQGGEGAAEKSQFQRGQPLFAALLQCGRGDVKMAAHRSGRAAGLDILGAKKATPGASRKRKKHGINRVSFFAGGRKGKNMRFWKKLGLHAKPT